MALGLRDFGGGLIQVLSVTPSDNVASAHHQCRIAADACDHQSLQKQHREMAPC